MHFNFPGNSRRQLPFSVFSLINWTNVNSKEFKLFNQAVEIIKAEGRASTSFLQRKLQIGYNRAARIIDMMEEKGIVSKANHVGKREVL